MENPYRLKDPTAEAIERFAQSANAPRGIFQAVGTGDARMNARAQALASLRAVDEYAYGVETMRKNAEMENLRYPAIKATIPYQNTADILEAQAAQYKAGAKAASQGVMYENLDPMVDKRMYTTDEAGNVRFQGQLMPRQATYTTPDGETVVGGSLRPDSAYWFAKTGKEYEYSGPPTPYGTLGAVGSSGELLPATGGAEIATPVTPNTAVAADKTGLVPAATPEGARTVIPRPVMKPGVNPVAYRAISDDVAKYTNLVNSIAARIKTDQDDLAVAEARGGMYGALKSVFNYGQIGNAENEMGYALRQLRKAKETKAAMEQMPAGYVSPNQGNYYNLDGATGAPPPPVANTATPLALGLPAQTLKYPAMVQTAERYQRYAPGGPGGALSGAVITALESGGRNIGNVGNASSAFGTAQITKETWRGVLKTMPEFKGRSDDEIEALRKDPVMQVKAERRLRELNHAIATKKYKGQFDPNHPLNLYAMHHFEPNVGAKIAAAFAKNRNMFVSDLMGTNEWAAVKRANPYLVKNDGMPMTVGELYSNWINRARKFGFFGGVANG